MVEEHKSRSGFSKRKHDKSESDCESVGDNFEMEYKPITNPKMASFDRCVLGRRWREEKNLETLVTNYYMILMGESYRDARDTIKRLKKRLTESYSTSILRDELINLRTIYENKDKEGLGITMWLLFKKKYENCNFWETYLELVEHPCFPKFDRKSGGELSGTGSGKVLSGPSSVNFNKDPINVAYDALERLNLEDKDLFYDTLNALKDERFEKIFMVLEDDDKRREFLYHQFRKKKSREH